MALRFKNGGEKGIRTLGTLLEHMRFPIAPVRPTPASLLMVKLAQKAHNLKAQKLDVFISRSILLFYFSCVNAACAYAYSVAVANIITLSAQSIAGLKSYMR